MHCIPPQQVLLHEQSENCERREGSYADHIFVKRVCGVTSPEAEMPFYQKFNIGQTESFSVLDVY